MRYAKLIEGSPVFAPNPLKYNGRRIANPKEELLLELGYLPVTQAPYPAEDPPDGYYWSPVWEERNGFIVQSWRAVQIETKAL